MREQCFHFVNNELFIKALPENNILKELLTVNQQCPSEIEQILLISVQKFAKGFICQKVTIFDFGENANNDTGSIFRISQLEETEIEHMNQSRRKKCRVFQLRNWNSREKMVNLFHEK